MLQNPNPYPSQPKTQSAYAYWTIS